MAGTPAIAAVEDVYVEITVVLGRSQMPIHQLLKMGRGAVIELDSREDDNVWVYANNQPIARGEIVLSGDRIAVSITDKLKPQKT
ncbi:FliM/FliN family flagellar motor switch protein [Zavarzinia sp. CC-PAN008]|uniref:FliM/FliN family flagellar motor switch protein n=1 Tax=Zavarzinia sp. CC-PAN008 TaxID=3243332 RepID=UPI003F7482A0